MWENSAVTLNAQNWNQSNSATMPVMWEDICSLWKDDNRDVEQLLKFLLGELKDGLPVSLEALHMKVLGSGIIMQHIALGPQGRHLVDHQVMLHRNSVT
jgi:hypothetical protein